MLQSLFPMSAYNNLAGKIKLNIADTLWGDLLKDIEHKELTKINQRNFFNYEISQNFNAVHCHDVYVIKFCLCTVRRFP